MPPNILLVVLDTARHDSVEVNASTSHTPAIADLARRGQALEQAYATASWTLPSHASIFSGVLARRLGLGQPPDGTPQSARPALQGISERLLTPVLRQAGYRAEGWSTNLWASPYAGFDIGFDQFRYVTSGREERLERLLGGGLRARATWARQGLQARVDDGAAEVRRALLDAIESWPETPTFWFVNLSECHSPYLPPRPWNDLGSWDRMLAALEARRYLTFEAICLHAAGRLEIPAGAMQRMRHLYRRAIAYMDAWVADVLEALDRRGILDETLVIVTSDHGENFGEGGLIAHGFSVDQRLIHVPLVSAGPGTIRAEGVFSLARLPGLIAGAAEISSHPWLTSELPEGVAVAQYDPMAARDDPRLRSFAQKWELDETAISRLAQTFTCATDGRHKLVISGEEESLFDLTADPDERHPLRATAGHQAADRLRSALAHPAVGGPADRDLRPSARADATSSEELEAIERQMKLLGYL